MALSSTSVKHCADEAGYLGDQATSSVSASLSATKSSSETTASADQTSISTRTSSEAFDQILTCTPNADAVIEQSSSDTQSDPETMLSQNSITHTDHAGDDQSSTTSADSTSPLTLFEVSPYPDKGLGLRATSAIEKGILILSEHPLITCPISTFADAQSVERSLRRLVNSLPEQNRNFFLHSLTDIIRDPAAPLTGRVRTNALPCGRNGSYGAVYKNIALANHSCVPNAEYQWHVESKQGVLRAVADIVPGEEITISYIDIVPHKQRQQKLKQCFDFVCACNLCNMSKKHRREEDKRIRETNILEMTLFNNFHELRHDLNSAFAKYQRLAVLYMESRQLRDRDLDRLWAGLADLCVAHLIPEQAVDRLMAMTEIPLDMAVGVVSTWYAEYDDEP